MTYEELKNQNDFDVSLNYSASEVAILAPSLDPFGGDDPVVTINKAEPFNYHPRDYRDTALDFDDWQEAVKLAQELALTPLNERGGAINHDWIKMAQRASQWVLGRGLKMGETIKWLLAVLMAAVIANLICWALIGTPVWRW